MPPEARRSALPLSLTSFIGRARELALVSEALADSRLVTLVGPGGIGKTRLAVEAARAWADEQPADALFIDLSSASDAVTVDRAVAAALEVTDEGKSELRSQVLRYLRAGSELVVFDNCEHVIDAAAAYVDDILRGCPGVRVLATSRESLAIEGETVLAVPPLDLESEAVPLFASRARAAAQDQAERASEAVIRRICEQLDGLPLAIELAAARTRALSLSELSSRLGDRFALLTVGNRSAPDRHKTLSAAVDWSYRLLSGREAALYERLSVFRDGFTLAAVETACSGEGIAREDVVDLLSSLVERSLVQRDAAAEPARYRLLETMREHAASKLQDPDTWSRRHFDWLYAQALEAVPGFRGPEKVAWLNYFSAERANLNAALRWVATRSGLEEERLRLATAVFPLWWFRGPISEGEEWLRRFLDDFGETLSPATIRARISLGTLWHSAGDLPGARAELERAIREARACAQDGLLGDALVWLSGVLAFQGETSRARTLIEEAAPLVERHGDQRDLARLALGRLWAWFEAERDWRPALEVVRQAGDPSLLGTFLNSLGEVARGKGDLDAARRYYQESLACHEQVGGRSGGRSFGGWLNLGLVALMQSDTASAIPSLQLALRNAVDAQTVFGISGSLLGTSLLAALLHRPAFAARLLGTAEALNRTIGLTLSQADSEAARRVRSLAAGEMGIDEFEAELRAGELAELEPVASEAAEFLEHEGQPRDADSVASPRPGGLSRQEAEVLRLLATGHTNREIAARLVLSVRTVENHVANAYGKVGARGRAEATAWAIANGLVSTGAPPLSRTT